MSPKPRTRITAPPADVAAVLPLPLAERKARRRRQRRARAIAAIQAEMETAPAPPLAVLVPLAVVFGTTHTHCRLENDRDPMLAKLLASLPAPDADPGVSEASPRADRDLWRAFACMSAAPAEASAACLWARLRPILLQRTTPNGEPSQDAAAWRETCRLAALLGIDSEEHLARSAAALPDPRCWAAEERAAAARSASAPAAAQNASPAPRSSRTRPPGAAGAPCARERRRSGIFRAEAQPVVDLGAKLTDSDRRTRRDSEVGPGVTRGPALDPPAATAVAEPAPAAEPATPGRDPHPDAGPATERFFTISDTWVAPRARYSLREDRHLPTVRIVARWLAAFGFDIGQRVRIQAEPGRLIITPVAAEPATGDLSGGAVHRRGP